MPRHATPFGTHAEARGAREGSPVWAGADLALNMFLAVTGFAQAARGGGVGGVCHWVSGPFVARSCVKSV